MNTERKGKEYKLQKIDLKELKEPKVCLQNKNLNNSEIPLKIKILKNKP